MWCRWCRWCRSVWITSQIQKRRPGHRVEPLGAGRALSVGRQLWGAALTTNASWNGTTGTLGSTSLSGGRSPIWELWSIGFRTKSALAIEIYWVYIGYPSFSTIMQLPCIWLLYFINYSFSPKSLTSVKFYQTAGLMVSPLCPLWKSRCLKVWSFHEEVPTYLQVASLRFVGFHVGFHRDFTWRYGHGQWVAKKTGSGTTGPGFQPRSRTPSAGQSQLPMLTSYVKIEGVSQNRKMNHRRSLHMLQHRSHSRVLQAWKDSSIPECRSSVPHVFHNIPYYVCMDDLPTGVSS